MSSIVRRTHAAPRALISRTDPPPVPRVLALDADTAVMLALDATRGMLEACLRGREPERSGRHVEVAAASAVPAAPPEALDEPSDREAWPAWRATQVRRAYLSTLPPPPDEPAPGCDRWA